MPGSSVMEGFLNTINQRLVRPSLSLVSDAAQGVVDALPENQFRTALLNGFGQFFIVILVVAGYQLYVLLESFLQPLAWAVLTGTILFPFKTAIVGWGKFWVVRLKATQTPLALGLFSTPFILIDKGLVALGDIVLNIFHLHTTAILWALIIFAIMKLSQLLIYVARIDVIGTAYWFAGFSVRVAASDWVWLIVLVYVIPLIFLWRSEYKNILKSLAMPVEISIGIHLLAKFGFVAFPVIIFGSAIFGIGFLSELKLLIGRIKAGGPQGFVQSQIDSWGPFSVLSPWHFSWWPGLVGTKDHIISGQIESNRHVEPNMHLTVLEMRNGVVPGDIEHASDDNEGGSEADRYLKILFKIFLVVQLFQNAEFAPLLVFPTIYSWLRDNIPKSTVYQVARALVHEGIHQIKILMADRIEVLVPRSAAGLYQMALAGDRKVLAILEQSLDEAAANLMIGLMFVFLTFSGVFVTLQVHNETSYIVRLSGEFMNKTLTEHPEYLTWLPEGAQVQDRLQNSFDSLYTYGRQFVGDAIRGAVEGTNASSSDQIANEVLTMMDRIYFSLVAVKNETNTTELATTPAVDPTQVIAEGSEALLAQASNMFSWSFIVNYGYAHFETLYSVLNSVVVIVHENGTLIASMATSILSFVLQYFSQFLDFILNTVFFLAALSFLLSISEDRYYPLEKVSRITDYFPEVGNVANIIEQAISGIFNASFKMAAFYGIYTYTLLSIFGVYVCFMPSVVAGIFAVIPLFPTYIVCVPALLELMVIRQDYFLAALLAVGSYLPTTFVDEVMYQEVKTAHPYMFGLSVAGGLMTMGIEGVVVGPIVLCFFVIVIELSRMILKPPESVGTPSRNSRRSSHN
ncbi:Transmembrane protein 245 [Hypsibius exemplaris]|uniref:Transmembrane protein 245 n=1 Tax=Hypsibius exemplaris TaxID=2072580 RepID=A0A1W0WKE1_HYPEX|nr:Transmembrane protein 245 [Hypsibius exemplaris]